ncbi:MAG: hypothetical protein IID51_08565 [Proteobacteria bacterium]|nr:hypothetical protein [Pseudomonadota bacterium]
MFSEGANKEKHYEVQAREGSAWIILNIYPDEAAAVSACAQLWKSGAHKAVRVFREKFDPKTNTYDAIELSYQGEKFKASEGGERSAPVCHNPADLYLRESRQAINRLLAEPFSKWQITAVELLYCPKHYSRLDNAGQTLQGAVQKMAAAQCKGLGQTVQQRMKELYSLIGRAAKRARSDWEEDSVPKISEDGLEPVIEALGEKGEEQEHLLAAALAIEFLPLGSISEKITRLLGLIHSDQPDWAIRVFDRFISEFFAFGSSALDFVGHKKELESTLVAAAHFARGESEEGTAPAKGGGAEMRKDGRAVLHSLLADKRLPATRRVLLGAIARALSGSDRLKDGALDEEFGALSRVAGALGDSLDELLGDIALINVFEDRSSRFLNPQFIAEYLKNADGPESTVPRLLDLEAHCFGREAKRRLANFLLPALGSHESEICFTRAGGNKLHRMRHLTELQARVLASAMHESHKKRMAHTLDKYCSRLLESSKLFERLDGSSNTALDAAKHLLTMIAGGCFTAGSALNAARRRAKEYFSVPEIADLLRKREENQAVEAVALKRLVHASGLGDGALECGETGV